uniref:COesterase domain-containing protein n=2 Tax=Bursaphelenchus xylophilus TaxID=6326 RepID=A0A1I7RSJ0_BURXY
MLFWLISLSFPLLLVTADPIFESHIGNFVGKTLEFKDGVKVDAFYGVPFARPPINDLRFEKPQDAEFVKERSAKTLPKVCVQQDYSNQMEMSEDCLYLNIFRPHQPSEDKNGYPALFFIHGGAFQVGSSHEHTTDYVAENYAGRGVVTIIPQYRLGLFGFASTGPEQFAGNYGLWDLRRALLFTRKNAKSLFLDPSKITVGGYSAGSAAASALSVSEHTRDLFLQTLQFSGSIFAEWALSNRPVIHTEKLVELLKCDDQSSAKIKKCLRQKSVRELQVAAVKVHETDGEINSFDYTPRLDADFFTADIAQLIESGKPKSSMMSLTENEGLLFTIYFSHAIETFPHALTKDKKDKFSLGDFKKFVRNVVAPQKLFGNKHKEVTEKIIDFYLRLKPEHQHDRTFYLDIHGKLLGDIMFVIPQLLELRHKTAAGWSIYNILSVHNDFIEENLSHLELYNTTHAIEYAYLFGKGFLGDHKFTEADEKYRKLLIDAVVTFVKTRSPKSDESPNFVKVNRHHPLIYTELSTEATIKDPLFANELRFWSKLSEEYEFDIIRGIHKKTLRMRTEL